MLTLKTDKYKKKDFAIMFDAIDKAIDSLNCQTQCEACESHIVCNDLMRLRSFVCAQYFKSDNKGNT